MDFLKDDVTPIPMTMTFTPPQGSTGPTWVSSPTSVTVDPRQTAVIAITLLTTSPSSPAAIFDTSNPMTWMPPAPPTWAMQGWLDQPTVLYVKSINQGPNPKGQWNFVVNVTYDGQTYTSPDPTIINIEPTGFLAEVWEEVEEVIAEVRALVA
jgi:hypothetical protein